MKKARSVCVCGGVRIREIWVWIWKREGKESRKGTGKKTESIMSYMKAFLLDLSSELI